MLREIDARPTPGIPIALLLDAAVIGGGFLVIMGARLGNGALAAGGGLLASLSLLSLSGLFAVSPNEAKVLTLFGNYKGTAKAPGLWFINPFMSKKNRLSVRSWSGR